MGHRASKVVKLKQSYNNGHLPYHCSFYHLARSMHDVACVNLQALKRCAVGMGANVLEVGEDVFELNNGRL